MRRTSPSTYDVVVVGARPAGAATAMLLARAGLLVLLVERVAPGTDTASTHALLRGGVVQLARWGLLEAVQEAGTPPVREVTFTFPGERVTIPLKPNRVDALYAPRRTVLDPLIARAAAYAGAEVRYRTRFRRLVWRGGRVVGVDVDGDAGSERIECRLVIGADGIRSNVAAQAGAETIRSGRHSSTVTYGYWSGVAAHGYEWLFRREANCGLIPTNGGQHCVFAAGPPERIGRGGVDVIHNAVRAADASVAARLDRGQAPQSTHTWRGVPGFMRRAHGPGWALVGDAGYFKDPISAHGLTDAMRDAELLARAVTARWDDADLEAGLADYQATRDVLSTRLFDVIDRIAGNTWDDAEIGDLLLEANAATADELTLLDGLGDLEDDDDLADGDDRSPVPLSRVHAANR